MKAVFAQSAVPSKGGGKRHWCSLIGCSVPVSGPGEQGICNGYPQPQVKKHGEEVKVILLVKEVQQLPILTQITHEQTCGLYLLIIWLSHIYEHLKEIHRTLPVNISSFPFSLRPAIHSRTGIQLWLVERVFWASSQKTWVRGLPLGIPAMWLFSPSPSFLIGKRKLCETLLAVSTDPQQGSPEISRAGHSAYPTRKKRTRAGSPEASGLGWPSEMLWSTTQAAISVPGFGWKLPSWWKGGLDMGSYSFQTKLPLEMGMVSLLL